MYIKQVVSEVTSEGEVGDCHWVAALTPTEETVVREYNELRALTMDHVSAWDTAYMAAIDRAYEKFNDWTWYEAADYIDHRVDSRLRKWLVDGEAPADEVVSA